MGARARVRACDCVCGGGGVEKDACVFVILYESLVLHLALDGAYTCTEELPSYQVGAYISKKLCT